MKEKMRERMIKQVRKVLTFGENWVKGIWKKIHYIILAILGRSEIIPEAGIKRMFLKIYEP